MAKFATVFELVAKTQPNLPVHVIRPHAVKHAAKWFLNNFPGKVVYAVKTNPDHDMLNLLHDAGIRCFDVASLHEIRTIAGLFPDASMHYMHPVKSRDSIRAAYFDYGVRDFSLDSEAELHKILEVTNHAQDLNLFVRLSVSNQHATLALTGKFGVPVLEAANLLRECQKYAAKTAICFHVGSQCMNPESFKNAMVLVANLLSTNGLSIDVLDVGGGFPAIYPGMEPPAMISYMEHIREGMEAVKAVNPAMELWCEPGRALVAEGGSLLVRVDLRKGNSLYINDGVYGSLFDAGSLNFVYPARMIADEGHVPSPEMQEFRFYGPTCDSLDTMEGPFLLPANINEGDWIELGQLGAYGSTLQSNFNGFFSDAKAFVDDAPMMSVFGLADADEADVEPLRAKAG